MYLNTLMAYFKYLDLNIESVSKKILEYINIHSITKNNTGAWVNADTNDILEKIPEISELFAPLGLTVFRVSFFIVKVSQGLIHIDDDHCHYRINFPILNCENTETRYYKTLVSPRKKYQLNGLAYHRYDPKHCLLVDTLILDRAAIIKTYEPHQVVLLHNNYPRISCTVAFNEDLKSLFDSL